MSSVCARCVMDTSDPDITFDSNGYCNHCNTFFSKKAIIWKKLQAPGNLEKTFDTIRTAGKGKIYDCIIGLSGGIDSSYMTALSKDFGLRPLLFHVDGGWNTNEATENICNIVRLTGFNFDKYVVDWEEMRDLQRAFLEAAVPNQDIPQDHLFFAILFHLTKKMDIGYWLSGANFASESILPSTWGFNVMDSRHLLAIHKKFGQRKLKNFPILSLWEYCHYYLGLGPSTVVRIDPLNMMAYDVLQAKKKLTSQYGWQDYGRKHGESVFTRFFQNFYLPTKFGYDKRKAHYSSLICSGQMTREEALEKLSEPLYSPEQLEADTQFICDKLGYSRDDFLKILSLPINFHGNYDNSTRFFTLASKAKTLQNLFSLLARGDFDLILKKIKHKFF